MGPFPLGFFDFGLARAGNLHLIWLCGVSTTDSPVLFVWKIFRAIRLDLWTLTDWETVDFPMDPQKVSVFAEGSTEAKSWWVSDPALHWWCLCLTSLSEYAYASPEALTMTAGTPYYISIYVYMYICIYVYMYICIYVYMYICIYVYLHI